MSICPVCHLQQPCDCDGIPPRDVGEPPALGHRAPRRLPPPIARHRPAGLAGLTSDDGTCPLDHGSQGAPELHGERTVCGRCTTGLRYALEEVPDLMTDLEIALTKQARFTERVGGSGASTALPFGTPAADAGWVARQTILANVDWVAQVRGHTIPDTWTEIATYLVKALGWIAAHPDGPQVVDELRAALRNAKRAIDRPAERTYLGRCGATIEVEEMVWGGEVVARVSTACPEELYAPLDRIEIDCPRCGTTYQVEARQDALLEQMRDHVLPAVDLARATTTLGVPVTPERIRLWKHRGTLAVATDDQGRPRADVRGRPLYRVGDVLDVLNDQPARG